MPEKQLVPFWRFSITAISPASHSLATDHWPLFSSHWPRFSRPAPRAPRPAPRAPRPAPRGQRIGFVFLLDPAFVRPKSPCANG